MTHKVHLDTDLGGDMDDLCALAMLLRWEDVEFTGITTVAEAGGRRAGYVCQVLEIEGRSNISVAAGADVSQGYYRYPELGYPDEERYWSGPVKPLPGPIENVIQLLKSSIEQRATIIAIGPFTNLYLLELQHPGILKQADLFLMGGYVYPIRPGFPKWDNSMDWNIQVDVRSARHVIENSNPVLIPLTVTVETALRRSYLHDLKNAGLLEQLIAQQSEAFAIDEQNEKRIGETCESLPDDIINFLHDPLACAMALGYREGVEIREVPLRLEETNGFLHEHIDPAGKMTRIVTGIDGPRFNQFWLDKIIKGE
jgi:inosine-uridine nucleoside N-ribohydrolase